MYNKILFIFCRYGANLVTIETLSESNMTSAIANEALGGASSPEKSYWLGLKTLNDLNTNTLESASGKHFSLYSGTTY